MGRYWDSDSVQSAILTASLWDSRFDLTPENRLLSMNTIDTEGESIDIEGMRRQISDGMRKTAERARKELAARSIALVEGTIAGPGNFVVPNDFFAAIDGPLKDQLGSVAVIEITVEDDPDDDDPSIDEAEGLVTELRVFVQMRSGTGWIALMIENLDSDQFEIEPDGEGEDERCDPSEIEALTLAVQAAEHEDFPKLSKVGQRRDLVLTLMTKMNPKFYETNAWPITEKADGYFKLGILPERAHERKALGEDADDISKALGVSKKKAAELMAMKIPDFIRDELIEARAAMA